MRKITLTILTALIICLALSGCAAADQRITLHETPQIYILQDEDSFALMPTVTLFENGNARLSQPMISSYAIVGNGRYKIDGDELTVTHGDNVSATFIISHSGDTLTLKSATLNFTKPGTVYTYQSKSDRFSDYERVSGETMTLNILQDMEKNAENLSRADFEKYMHIKSDPDVLIFDIDGKYTLTFSEGYDGSQSASCENSKTGEAKIILINQ